MTAAFRRRKVSAHVREVCLNFHREATGEVMPETSLRAYAETEDGVSIRRVPTANHLDDERTLVLDPSRASTLPTSRP